MSKPVILTGLRANNDLHLGNYLGALLPMVDMANKHAGEYQINLFVPDLHSFTTPIDHSKLYQQVLDNVRVYIAAGLNTEHDDVFLYRQSFVPAHSELTWILENFSSFGALTRMTQFKEKSGYKDIARIVGDGLDSFEPKIDEIIAKKHPSFEEVTPLLKDFTKLSRELLENERKGLRTNVGLFNYPVMMAADILLYSASYVPVGDDQTQHLEYTRDIAELMNNKFGELFMVPKPVKEQHQFFGKDQGLRVRDLQDTTKKMSKSDETGNGVIFLSDTPEAATKKIMAATTDSIGVINLDFEKQPGISNLLQIHALLSGETLEAVAKHHGGQTNYGELKQEVAKQVAAFLTDFQNKLATVDESAVLQKLEASETAMNEQANQTLRKVQQAVGLRPKT